MAAPKKKPAAAQAEKKDEPKSLKWNGLELTLPPELPESVMFDVVEAEASGSTVALLRTLRSVLGADQFAQVRYRFEQLGDKVDAMSLFESVMGEYGMSLGES